MEIKVFTNIF